VFCTLRILFFGFVFIGRICCAASSSQSPTEFSGGFNESQRELNRQILQDECHDDNLSYLLARYQTNLPTESQAQHHIEAMKFRHPEWANEFARKISHLQNPLIYKGVRYPSRMLYHGPSGCGKTYTTLALAKICNMECLLIPGSSVETSYRRSGPEFLETLFQTLLTYPNRRFLIVFDELRVLAQYSKDERDIHQHATVTKLWQCLDLIEKQRHICVVGTDNLDPQKYESQMQTRFFNSIFKFNRADASSAAGLSMLRLATIRENSIALSIPHDSSSSMNSAVGSSTDFAEQSFMHNNTVKNLTRDFTDKQLEGYLSGVSHLTDREKLELVQCAAEIAVFNELNSPTESSEIALKVCHLNEAFKKYQRTCIQRFFSHPFVKQLCSVRALSYYIAAASFGLRIYDPTYIPHSTKLIVVAQCINALDPNNKEKLRDLQLFNALTTTVEYYESHKRYCDGLRRQQEALKLDAERYEQSRKDFIADWETENTRYEQSRIDRDNALKLDADRYEQSRKDLEEDERRHIAQFRIDQSYALRGQYIKGIDMVFDVLEQNLLAAQDISDLHQRASTIENAWTDVERQLLQELRHRKNEIQFTEGLWGTPFSDSNKKLVKAFYSKHKRAIPDELRCFV
jgi:SpoVK/Ycf46/Vps4 family AAA+-type ATPase